MIFRIQTAAAIAALIATSAGNAMADGDAAKGANYVKGRCTVCHSIEKGGGNRIGPNLYGVYGRHSASAPGYSYSGAMKNSGIVWTADKLKVFLHNPRVAVPGTKMTYAGIPRDEDLANTIAYLATLK
ncbi:MAG: c-type cytochrome [Alphaproteobacteria bacterium]|nr:c-type cytochrome [Alphaproteobacteria bacterium]